MILPLFGHHRCAAEFALVFAIALIVTTIISALAPAIGVYHALGILPADQPNLDPVVYYGTLKELPLVRDGTTRLLNAYFLGPVLTFPSFHAISAVLYVWAFWPFRWLRLIGLLWNAVMVAATPTIVINVPILFMSTILHAEIAQRSNLFFCNLFSKPLRWS